MFPYYNSHTNMSYVMSHCYKLRDWIDQDKLEWKYLCSNPGAIHLIREAIEQYPEYPDKIDWDLLSENPNAIPLIEEVLKTNPDNI